MASSSSSTSLSFSCQRRLPYGWCNVALPFVLLAGIVHLTNVVYLDRRGLLWSSPSSSMTTVDHTAATDSILQEDGVSIIIITEIVWLMSFPNSGTSYTIVNTEQLTGMTTATNYGVPEVHDDPPVPVRPDQPNSPYWHYNALPKPRRAFTKTHCDTVLTFDDFEKGCRTININNSTGHPEEYQYNASLVAGAVHLIRHPLDNLVSRKHHMLRREVNTGILTAVDAQERFPDTAQGLRSWCDYKLNKTRIWQQFPPTSLDAIAPGLSSVPCYGDLLYYIQWHSLAAKTLVSYQIPVHVLYYEDYSLDYNATIQSLYQFVFDKSTSRTENTSFNLQWDRHVPFEDTKVYHDLFTESEQAAVAKAVETLSSSSGWALLQRYYSNSSSSD